MLHRGASALLVVPTIALALFMVGCPKRPATTAVSAPAPSAAPAPRAAAPAAPAPAPAPAPAQPRAAAPTAPAAPAPAAPRSPAPLPPPAEFAPHEALKAIHFDFDKYDIRPGDAKILDGNASWLKSNPNNLILIEGHCDERGTNEYNLALGERRAKSTMNYLVAQGVQASRITIISYGEERPVCAEKEEGCWSKNRRAQFLVKPR
jgi:peptidoglycan-associated lipoprotein